MDRKCHICRRNEQDLDEIFGKFRKVIIKEIQKLNNEIDRDLRLQDRFKNTPVMDGKGPIIDPNSEEELTLKRSMKKVESYQQTLNMISFRHHVVDYGDFLPDDLSEEEKAHILKQMRSSYQMDICPFCIHYIVNHHDHE